MKRTASQIWLSAHGGKKPQAIQLTDPVEIEAVQSTELDGIHGFCMNGVWYGYSYSVERFRKQNAGAALAGSSLGTSSNEDTLPLGAASARTML